MTLEGKDWPQPSKCSMSWGDLTEGCFLHTGPQQWGTSNRMLLPFGLCQRYLHILSLLLLIFAVPGTNEEPCTHEALCLVAECYISLLSICIFAFFNATITCLVIQNILTAKWWFGKTRSWLHGVWRFHIEHHPRPVSRVTGPQVGGRKLMVCISQAGVPVRKLRFSVVVRLQWVAAYPTFWASAALTKDHELGPEQRKYLLQV